MKFASICVRAFRFNKHTLSRIYAVLAPPKKRLPHIEATLNLYSRICVQQQQIRAFAHLRSSRASPPPKKKASPIPHVEGLEPAEVLGYADGRAVRQAREAGHFQNLATERSWWWVSFCKGWQDWPGGGFLKFI